ncbi:MAG: class I SAM-dependent methyltransferase, partial [Gemmataceae bacterium]
DRLQQVEGTRDFLRCSRCHSVVIDSIPHDHELESLYPSVYSFQPNVAKSQSLLKQWVAALEHRLFFGLQYQFQARAVLNAVGHSSARGKRLLDIGCGRGLRLLEFHKLGFQSVGLDVLPEVVESIKRDLNLDAVCVDASQLDAHFDPSTFDVVTAFQLIEHMPNVAQLIATIYRVLKPGGLIGIAVPLVDGVHARLFGDRWIGVTEAPRHISLPTQQGLLTLLGNAGFESPRVRADEFLNCSGVLAMSLLPAVSLTHAYGQSRLSAILPRLFGAVLTIPSGLFTIYENYIARQPSVGFITARKPLVPKC